MSQTAPKVPTTLEEAHQILAERLDKTTLNGIDASNAMDWMDQFHHSLGRYLRNSWQLWVPGTPLRLHLEELGLLHPDDMSGVILNSFWCKRHGTEYDLQAAVAAYKKYWSVMAEERTTFMLEVPVPTNDPMIQFARQSPRGTITKEAEGCN